jgi:predicted O-linked N-acetylglucosamine transferase (SPINDLY family)
MALHSSGQLPEAEKGYRQILEASPGHPGALYLLGVIACQVGRYATALELLDRAILVKPDYPEACLYRGIAQHGLHRYDAALGSCDQAILLKPDFAEAHLNRGTALHALRRYQAALESCDQAILLKPEFPEAFANRGNALQALLRFDAALESYDRAIRLRPDWPEAHNNRGSAFHSLRQYQAALASFDRALALRPDYAEACVNRGNTLLALKQYQGALAAFDRALILRPDSEYLRGSRLHVKSFLCDWEDWERDARQLEAAIGRGEQAALPFAMLAVSDSPAIQKQAAEIHVRDQYPGPPVEIPARHPTHSRLRIGYFSADYYDHATSYLMAELLERHDRTRFEIVGFSFGPPAQDEMGRRVSAAMDRFIDAGTMTDREIAHLARELEVDIAVDLKGFTKQARPGIFAQRAAPIQVSYLGYPGTMAAPFIDYLIADPTVIPESAQPFYSERIVYLPDTYQANDSQRGCPVAESGCPIFATDSSSLRWDPTETTRAAEHLPESAFVFCCFNTTYKITPSVFDLWMRILAQVPASVLWLLEDNPLSATNLRKEAARRGIASERLVFARPLPLAQHLARLKLADLYLDTFPYNAHTTASDALFVALPVLTRSGESFASRVAASLLRALSLPEADLSELIATTPAEYERLAIELALHPERLRHLRERLAHNGLTAPLFDTAAFTRHIEAAYTAMHARYLAGLPPATIYIPHSPAAASE